MEHMDNPELREYIQDRLGQGETTQYIRATLRANGWPDQAIEGALATAGGGLPTNGSPLTGDTNRTLPKIASPPPVTGQSTLKAKGTKSSHTRTFTITAGVILLLLIIIVVWSNASNSSASSRRGQDTPLKAGLNDLAAKLTVYYAVSQTYPAPNKLSAAVRSSTARNYSYQSFSSTGDVCDGQAVACTRVILSTKLSNGSHYLVILDHSTESH